MKTSTEKSATTTSTTATQPTQEPFFGKKGGDGFFDNAQQGNAPFIQAKLTINQPGDIYEQEADRVADQVVQRLAMPSSQPATPLSSTTARSPEAIQTKCADCEQEEKLQRKEEEGPEESEEIQRKENAASPAQPGDEAGSDFSSRLQSSKGGGSPLPENTRTDMESALGADLSGVRIHTGSEAAGMSKTINAQAFTHGSDVYFNEGKFDAGSTDGKRLLAHELVHTVQQDREISPKIQRQTLANATAQIRAGNIRAGLADPDMRAAFSTAGGKSLDLEGMQTVLNEVIANGLGITLLPPVTGNPPFSQYTVLQRSAIAYVLGMIKLRQDYIKENDEFLIHSIDPLRPDAGLDYMNSSLSYSKILNNIKTNFPESFGSSGTGVPFEIFQMISENPDMPVMEKSRFLAYLKTDLQNNTSTYREYETDPGTPRENIFDKLYQSDNYQEQQGLLLDDSNRLKSLIDEEAKLFFSQMGVSVETTMGDSILASSGDTSNSSGLLGSKQSRGPGNSIIDDSVGVGYFMYSRRSGQPINEAIIGNDLTIYYPPTSDTIPGERLEIMLNAYGYDVSNSLDITINVRNPNTETQKFEIKMNGNPDGRGNTTTDFSNMVPGITVSTISTGTYAYISLDKRYQGSTIDIKVSRGVTVPSSSHLVFMDEIQLMVTTSGKLGSNVYSIEAKELFESGSFVSKDVSTLKKSDKPSENELAKKIVDFAATLNISKIIGLLTLTEEGEAEDFSQFFNLQGIGINENAPIPQSFRKENPGLNNTQLLDKLQQLNKDQLIKYYQIDSGYDKDVTYEMIIDSLETYRSSKAKMSGDKIDITSTTDPQGTGINPGSPGVNNDFPDYYNHYIKKTVFGHAVERDGLLKRTGNIISRENNEILSALRSLSFLKLILEQKGLTESDFTKMNVKVFVGSTEEPANLAQIPTEFSVFYSEP